MIRTGALHVADAPCLEHLQGEKPCPPCTWELRRDHYVRVLVREGIEPFWPATEGERARLSPYAGSVRCGVKPNVSLRRPSPHVRQVLAAVPCVGDEARICAVVPGGMASQVVAMMEGDPRFVFFTRSSGYRTGRPAWWVRRVKV